MRMARTTLIGISAMAGAVVAVVTGSDETHALPAAGPHVIAGPSLVHRAEWQGGKPKQSSGNWGGYGGGQSSGGKQSGGDWGGSGGGSKKQKSWDDDQGGSKKSSGWGGYGGGSKKQKSWDDDEGGSKKSSGWEGGSKKQSDNWEGGTGSSKPGSGSSGSAPGSGSSSKPGGTGQVTMACASKCKSQCVASTGFVVGQSKGADKFNACVGQCRTSC